MINFRKMNERNKKIKKNFWQIFYAILAALVIRSFLYEPFSIPSGSMYPNLKVGDYLFVSKFSYGFSRNSLPFSIPLIPGRIFYKEPQRGDIIIFKIYNNIPNHCGVYLEEDIFIHHAENRLSCRESLYPFWIKNILRYARYAKS